MKLNEVLSELKILGTQIVIVTGPHRSGTRIGTRILADCLGYKFVDEREYGCVHAGRFMMQIQVDGQKVIQAPGVLSALPFLSLPWYTHIVVMRRDLKDIVASRKRVHTSVDVPQHEKDRYRDLGLTFVTPFCVTKYEFCEKYLPDRIELDYESMRGHPLWRDPEKRQYFKINQTE